MLMLFPKLFSYLSLESGEGSRRDGCVFVTFRGDWRTDWNFRLKFELCWQNVFRNIFAHSSLKSETFIFDNYLFFFVLLYFLLLFLLTFFCILLMKQLKQNILLGLKVHVPMSATSETCNCARNILELVDILSIASFTSSRTEGDYY